MNEGELKQAPNSGAKVQWSSALVRSAAEPPGTPIAEAPALETNGDADEDGLAQDGLREELAGLGARLGVESDRNTSLNRELGLLSRRLAVLEESAEAERASSRLKNAFVRVRSIFVKRKGVDDVPPAEPVWDELRRRAPLVPHAEANAGKRVIAVTTFRLSPKKLSSVLDTVEGYCRKRDTVPVFLTDSDHFELFHERRLAF